MPKKVLSLLISLIIFSAQIFADSPQDLRILFDGARAQAGVPVPVPGFPAVPIPIQPQRQPQRGPDGVPVPPKPAVEEPKDLEPKEFMSDLAGLLLAIQMVYPGDITNRQLRDGAYRGALRELDPHSKLFTPEEFKKFQERDNGSFGGVGLVVDKKEKEEYQKVRYPIPGTPAYRAGIKPGDIIAKINGEETDSMGADEVVEKLRGPPGSSVKVTIFPKGVSGLSAFKEITLTREEISVPNFYSTMLKPSVGYISFASFNSGSADEFQKSLDMLSKQGMKKLVIDLRDNPGGNLYDALYMCKLFLSRGQVILEERKKTNREIIKVKDDGPYRDLPVVILVNKGSASASEILAGVLQDHRKAKLIGSTTFGKGSVQQLFVDVPEDGYGVKMTIAKYYLPSGRSPEPDGLKPDIEVLVDPDTEAKIAQNKYLMMNGQKPEEPVKDTVLEKALQYFAATPASK